MLDLSIEIGKSSWLYILTKATNWIFLGVLSNCNGLADSFKKMQYDSTNSASAIPDLYWQLEAKIKTIIRDLATYGEKMLKAAEEFGKYADVSELLLEAKGPQDTLQSVGQWAGDLENLKGLGWYQTRPQSYHETAPGNMIDSHNNVSCRSRQM